MGQKGINLVCVCYLQWWQVSWSIWINVNEFNVSIFLWVALNVVTFLDTNTSNSSKTNKYEFQTLYNWAYNYSYHHF